MLNFFHLQCLQSFLQFSDFEHSKHSLFAINFEISMANWCA